MENKKVDKKEDNGKERKAAETERKEKLIIEGNAVYELDEECMLRKRLDQTDEEEKREAEGWVVGKYPKEDTKK